MDRKTNILTYSDLMIQPLDLQFIDKICDKFDLSIDDVELNDVIHSMLENTKNSVSYSITNYIIYHLLYLAVDKEVDDEGDKNSIIDSIYTNAMDSGFNIDESELNTNQAKEFLYFFND